MKKSSFYLSLLFSFMVLALPMQGHAKTNQYGLPDFTKLVEQTHQSVVNISTTKKVTRQTPPQFRGMPEELLRHFFGMPSVPGNPQAPQAPREQSHSLGSGFIISADGYILTNHHVIEGADEIVVRMRDRQELIAEVIGSDARTDVAVLKIEAKNLPYAKIGDSSSLKVGQWVLAIGEPFGLDFTATHGIISALGRSLPDDTYVPFIQSDVPINPGNSGGPLFNLKGEVIGINSQIYSKTGGSMGLSFSIPINIAMTVSEQIKENGKVSRGYLGVQIQEVTSELAKSFGLDKPKGALVVEAYPGTAAKKAGIKSGDVIIEFDGKPINKSADLPPIVGVTSLDRQITVKILRKGKTKYLKVRLNSLEQSEQIAQTEQTMSSATNRLGALAKNLDDNIKDSSGISKGVIVTQVDSKGPAAQIGMLKGDIIVELGFNEIADVKSLKRALKTLPTGKPLSIRIIRRGNTFYRSITLQE